MKFLLLLVAVVCGGIRLAVAHTAIPEELCNSRTFQLQVTPWAQAVSIPAFDPSFGTLLGVRFTLDSHITGSVFMQSQDLVGQTLTALFQATCTLRRPDSTVIVQFPHARVFTVLLPPGGSAFFPGLVMDQGATMTSVVPSGDLALFSGPSGNPGSIVLTVSTANTSTASGPALTSATFQQAGSAVVTVCYLYTPGANFCFGNGSGTSCPCGPGGAFTGCPNSVWSVGGRLTASGNPRISNDTLVLSSINSIPTGPVLYFQGSQPIVGGSPFGNGLLCLTGSTPRLEVRFSNAAGVSPTTVQIHVLGAANSGDLRYYQMCYRDDPSFCTGAGFGTTNAVSLMWLP